ncbi:hypothetical protein KEM55_002426 [Ascosphaera atra]|nr:hypothetical protein KEM55_002426 [Ascosphaera atra]
MSNKSSLPVRPAAARSPSAESAPTPLSPVVPSGASGTFFGPAPHFRRMAFAPRSRSSSPIPREQRRSRSPMPVEVRPTSPVGPFLVRGTAVPFAGRPSGGRPRSLSPVRRAPLPPSARPARASSVGLHLAMVGPVLPRERCSSGVHQDALEATVRPSTPSAVEITPAECLPPPPDVLVAQCHERLEAKKARQADAAAATNVAVAPPLAPSASPADRAPAPAFLPVEEEVSVPIIRLCS